MKMKHTCKRTSGTHNAKTRKLWAKVDAGFNHFPEVQLIKEIEQKCPVCQSAVSIMEDGSFTCISPNCGNMSGFEISMAPDGINASEGSDNTDTTRYGCPINPLLPESSFGAQIICRPGASTEMKFMSRIAKWGSAPSHEKTLYTEFEYIATMARNADIPTNIIEHAFIIHKCNLDQQLYRGGNRDGIKAGSIYIACMLNGCPRTPHEIANMFKLNHKSVLFGCTQAMNMIHRLKAAVYDSELGIGIDGLDFNKLTDIKPSHFIARYCSQLHISGDILNVARFIADIIESHSKKYNSKPSSMAGGIILYISNHLRLGIPKSRIAPLCGVSDVTIVNCCSWIQSQWDELIPQVILEQHRRPEEPRRSKGMHK
jgi:transcription initiation factor TFIIB